ncbi:hypothetical protein KM043_005731 [Ampulex compressa]|nr:hypothetical protein KM043_005731 [Ampulex compressa]
MNIVMKLKYQMKDTKWRDVTLTVPQKATLEGTCGDKVTNAALVWDESTAKALAVEDDKKSKVVLSLLNKDDKFSVDSIALDLYMSEKNFPNTDETRLTASTNTSLGLFSASSKNGVYRCSGEVEVPVGKQAALTISDVSLIAFNTDKNIDSKSERNCVAAASTNVGAIVGGVIGGLALVGIISFVIWRKRRNDLNRSEMP